MTENGGVAINDFAVSRVGRNKDGKKIEIIEINDDGEEEGDTTTCLRKSKRSRKSTIANYMDYSYECNYWDTIRKRKQTNEDKFPNSDSSLANSPSSAPTKKPNNVSSTTSDDTPKDINTNSNNATGISTQKNSPTPIHGAPFPLNKPSVDIGRSIQETEGRLEPNKIPVENGLMFNGNIKKGPSKIGSSIADDAEKRLKPKRKSEKNDDHLPSGKLTKIPSKVHSSITVDKRLNSEIPSMDVVVPSVGKVTVSSPNNATLKPKKASKDIVSSNGTIRKRSPKTRSSITDNAVKRLKPKRIPIEDRPLSIEANTSVCNSKNVFEKQKTSVVDFHKHGNLEETILSDVGKSKPRRKFNKKQCYTPSLGKNNDSSSSSLGDGEDSEGSNKSGQMRSDIEDEDGNRNAKVKPKVGDCVMLASPNPNEKFVALVRSFNRSLGTFMAQWYYHPEDIPKEVLEKHIAEDKSHELMENEIFLSSHKDKNSLKAIESICQVVSPQQYQNHKSKMEYKKSGIDKHGEVGEVESSDDEDEYFVCRFKFRSKSPEEGLIKIPSSRLIRCGLGSATYLDVGPEFQATIPNLSNQSAEQDDGKGQLKWSNVEEENFTSFFRGRMLEADVKESDLGLVDVYFDHLQMIKFANGNHAKFFDFALGTHVHCEILRYFYIDKLVQVRRSNGRIEVVAVRNLISPLYDDMAFELLYSSGFDCSRAWLCCTKSMLKGQVAFKESYEREIRMNKSRNNYYKESLEGVDLASVKIFDTACRSIPPHQVFQ